MPDLVPPPPGFTAAVTPADYAEMARRAVDDADAFWLEQAERLEWLATPTEACDASFDLADLHIRWFADGTLNACHNALDRHVANGLGERTAFCFEPDDPDDDARRREISYAEALRETQRMANVLKGAGVTTGDRVTIYLPMIPEAAYTMLACARIGAVFSVIFAGFSPESIAGRLVDAGSDVIVTADQGRRGGRTIALKANVDAAVEKAEARGQTVRTVLVVRSTGGNVLWNDARDVWTDEAPGHDDTVCACEAMDAESPLFILYTSGSTGAPKGVLHTTGGYCVWASLTHSLTFDLRPETDIFWCTADVGWITGHSYLVFGPMLNAATQVFFEGVPTFPDAGRMWAVVDRWRVTQIYTAPTAIRALMAAGDDFVTRASRASLRILGTVGEPINPEAWRWYSRVVGEGRCPVVDTWWQTETGGVMIGTLPGAGAQVPGAAGFPMVGVVPEVVDGAGTVLEGAAEGILTIRQSWPGQARTIYGDHARFAQTYFSAYPGRYFTGDGVRRDAEGRHLITGRVDDVINVSGHRMGTAEVESALVLHPAVAEAAVVGVEHAIKGQAIYAYVALGAGHAPNEDLRDDLRQHVRRTIGALAQPEFVQFAIGGLPKTRSGKIMRRILRKIAANEHDALGDTTTLADPEVVEKLIVGRRNRPEDERGGYDG